MGAAVAPAGAAGGRPQRADPVAQRRVGVGEHPAQPGRLGQVHGLAPQCVGALAAAVQRIGAQRQRLDGSRPGLQRHRLDLGERLHGARQSCAAMAA